MCKISRSRGMCIWMLAAVSVIGCGQRRATSTRETERGTDTIQTEASPTNVSVVGSILLEAKDGLNSEPTYTFDGKSCGDGVTGYREVLEKLRQLPHGSSVHLASTGRLPGDAKWVGDVTLGGHPFLWPPGLFTELNRIASERHLDLQFDPPLETVRRFSISIKWRAKDGEKNRG